jgi:hypothetical protein
MGDWNITIRGTGIHHNADAPNDADRMAAAFVADLKAKGHTVRSATITSGGETDITEGEKYLADKAAQVAAHSPK